MLDRSVNSENSISICCYFGITVSTSMQVHSYPILSLNWPKHCKAVGHWITINDKISLRTPHIPWGSQAWRYYYNLRKLADSHYLPVVKYSLDRRSRFVHLCCKKLCTSWHSSPLCSLQLLEFQYQIIQRNSLCPLVGIGHLHLPHTMHKHCCLDEHTWGMLQQPCTPHGISFHSWSGTKLLVLSLRFSNAPNPSQYCTLQGRGKGVYFLSKWYIYGWQNPDNSALNPSWPGDGSGHSSHWQN